MVRVLVTDGMDKNAMAKLQEMGHEVVVQFYEPDQLGAALKEFDAVVVRSKTKVRAEHIDVAKEGKLKLVIRGGVGIDNIDHKYAEEQGIAVRNTPAASSASVAELALGHMFSLARFIGISNYTMRVGEWNKKQYEGTEIGGKTLGLIGCGRIARELAKRAEALGMTVIYTDIMGEIPGVPYKFMSKEDVLKNADYVSLHVPAPADKKPIIGAAELAMMKPTACIVNTARGILIDPDALCDALDAGNLAGAALDVYPEEPLNIDRIKNNPKISMTPHIGGSTKEAQGRIGDEIVDIITKFFA